MLENDFEGQLVGMRLKKYTIPSQSKSMWFHELHCSWFSMFWYFLCVFGSQLGWPHHLWPMIPEVKFRDQSIVTQTERLAAVCIKACCEFLDAAQVDIKLQTLLVFSSPICPSWMLILMTPISLYFESYKLEHRTVRQTVLKLFLSLSKFALPFTDLCVVLFLLFFINLKIAN